MPQYIAIQKYNNMYRGSFPKITNYCVRKVLVSVLHYTTMLIIMYNKCNGRIFVAPDNAK